MKIKYYMMDDIVDGYKVLRIKSEMLSDIAFVYDEKSMSKYKTYEIFKSFLQKEYEYNILNYFICENRDRKINQILK